MEMKICRWCGADPILIEEKLYDITLYFVEINCEHTMSGPAFHTKESAISAWNELMGSYINRKERIERAAIELMPIIVALESDCPAKLSVEMATELINEIDALEIDNEH